MDFYFTVTERKISSIDKGSMAKICKSEKATVSSVPNRKPVWRHELSQSASQTLFRDWFGNVGRLDQHERANEAIVWTDDEVDQSSRVAHRKRSHNEVRGNATGASMATQLYYWAKEPDERSEASDMKRKLEPHIWVDLLPEASPVTTQRDCPLADAQ